jgi:hypothetical protein
LADWTTSSVSPPTSFDHSLVGRAGYGRLVDLVLRLDSWLAELMLDVTLLAVMTLFLAILSRHSSCSTTLLAFLAHV